MASLKITLQVRRDSNENWNSVANTFIPKEGEPCFDTDLKKLKVGDGTTPYAALPYIGGTTTTHNEVVRDKNESGGYDVTDIEAITATLTELGIDAAEGDTFTVKSQISGSLYSFTAYVFNDGVWKAMDGNYNAENVYFSEGIQLAGEYDSVGNVSLSDGTLGDSGMSLKDMFSAIFTKELNPTISSPTINLTASGSVTKEVGSEYSLPTATLSVTSVGSYSFGSASKDENGELTDKDKSHTSADVQFTSMSITNDKTSDTASSSNSNNNLTLTTTIDKITTESMKNLLVTDSEIKYNFSASATYADSERYPLTNLSNEYKADDGSAKNITTGTLTKSASATIKGFRNYWYGFINNAEYSALTRDAESNSVGNGTVTLTAGGKAIANGALPVLTSKEGDAAIVILVPNSAKKKVTSATLPDSFDAPIEFTTHSKALQINGYNGYTAVDYDVLIYAPASIPVGTRFNITIGAA